MFIARDVIDIINYADRYKPEVVDQSFGFLIHSLILLVFVIIKDAVTELILTTLFMSCGLSSFTHECPFDSTSVSYV